MARLGLVHVELADPQEIVVNDVPLAHWQAIEDVTVRVPILVRFGASLEAAV
jgi:hypothetical protein